jgi:hypothetical protein
MFHKRILFMLLLGAFLIVGCSTQDDPTQPVANGQSLSAIIHGEFSKGEADFEFAAEVGEGVDPDQGALLVRGRNLAYDDELGALTIDLSVYNDSEVAYDELVGLTMLQFIPEGVTILDSDNDLDGPGALVIFDFEDEDGLWSPGEESLTRTVSFVVASGTSLGFMARIDVGMSEYGGAIGGMAWHDVNEDGILDPDEAGVGGVGIALFAGADTTAGPMARVMTSEDGTYRFDGLDAGSYNVVRMPLEGAVGTTSPEITVILVEMDGVVSDFLMADFGLTRGGDTGGDDFVKVGDYVDAKGDYAAEPDRLVSDKFKVKRCDGDDYDDGDDDDDDCRGDCDDEDDDEDKDHNGGCRENECWGRLTGKVTGFSYDRGFVEVMGTKVFFDTSGCDDDDDDKDRGHDDCDHGDWERGFRVQVDAYRDADLMDGNVMACRKAHAYKGKDDKVKGFVQEVITNEDGYITGVIVLNTLVTVPRHENDFETPVFTGALRVNGRSGESR